MLEEFSENNAHHEINVTGGTQVCVCVWVTFLFDPSSLWSAEYRTYKWCFCSTHTHTLGGRLRFSA